jgi:hypothetical protein
LGACNNRFDLRRAFRIGDNSNCADRTIEKHVQLSDVKSGGHRRVLVGQATAFTFLQNFDLIDKTLGAYKNNSSNPLSSTVVDKR